jgi:hypothetical protein
MKNLHALLRPLFSNFHLVVLLLVSTRLLVMNRANGTPLSFWQFTLILGLLMCAYGIWLQIHASMIKYQFRALLGWVIFLVGGMPILVSFVVYTILPWLGEPIHEPDVPFSWVQFAGHIMNGQGIAGSMAGIYFAIKWMGVKSQEKSAQNKERPERDFIIVKEGLKDITIKHSDIIYIESDGNYLNIIRHEKDSVRTRMSLIEFEKLLPVKDFVRVHRSYVVHWRFIAGLEKGKPTIHLHGTKKKITIGKNYYEEFRKRWKKGGGLMM